MSSLIEGRKEGRKQLPYYSVVGSTLRALLRACSHCVCCVLRASSCVADVQLLREREELQNQGGYMCTLPLGRTNSCSQPPSSVSTSILNHMVCLT